MNRCITRRDALASISLAAAATALAPARAAWADDYANAAPLASAEEIDFLYIDNAEMAPGEEQNIVVALKRFDALGSAVLTVRDPQTGAEETLGLTKADANALLFTFYPASAGAFEVSSLQFRAADGSAYVMDFADADASYRSYFVAPPIARFSAKTTEGPELRVMSGEGEEDVAESGSFEEASASAVSVASVARAAEQKKGTFIVALDPGHVAMDPGAIANGLKEADATWKIAQACKAELEVYKNIKVVYTVTPDNPVRRDKDLQDRVQRAVNQNADVLVSLHINSAGGSGAEVWAPYNTEYNHETHEVGVGLGKKILDRLVALGLNNRGVKFRVINDDETNDPKWDYDGGIDADYYGIIRYARRSNLPAIIVEHAFIDNWNDFNKYLSSDAKLHSLGVADARGIATYFGLTAATGTVYRLYHEGTKDHHYTKDLNEYRVLATRGWTQEGIAWYSAPEKQGKPVYRLYHEGTKNHHYTIDENEYRVLATRGWKQEGIAWYSAPEKQGKPVYRLYHSGTLDHHYTKDENEYRVLATRGWRQEGLAWRSQE